jgi:hypothetical protein
VTRVDLTGEYRLAVGFSDGTEQRVDLAPAVTSGDARWFGELRDQVLFGQVQIDTFGSLRWPNGVGLDPWTLHDWPSAGPTWITRVQRNARHRRRLRASRIWLFAAAMALFAWNLAAWFGFVDAGNHSQSQLVLSAGYLVISGASLIQARVRNQHLAGF